jgi:hypothetical protein
VPENLVKPKPRNPATPRSPPDVPPHASPPPDTKLKNTATAPPDPDVLHGAPRSIKLTEEFANTSSEEFANQLSKEFAKTVTLTSGNKDASPERQRSVLTTHTRLVSKNVRNTNTLEDALMLAELNAANGQKELLEALMSENLTEPTPKFPKEETNTKQTLIKLIL